MSSCNWGEREPRQFSRADFREFERFIRDARRRGCNGFEAINELIDAFELNRAERNQITINQWHLSGPNHQEEKTS